MVGTPLIQTRPAGAAGAAFACSDLAACSLADLGTKDHDLLGGLLDDDHPIYGLLSGRSGGQTFKGGAAASEHLTLQSTAHATRGYVRAQDDLQLLSNILRDSGGNNRVQLATASPHVTLSGLIRTGDKVGIGAAPSAYRGLYLQPSLQSAENMYLIGGNPIMRLTANTRQLFGYQGMGTGVISSGATAMLIAGLYFTAVGAGAGTVQNLYAAWVRTGFQGYAGPAAALWGVKVRGPLVFAATYPTVSYGVDIDDQGFYAAGSHDAIGLRIADQTNTSGNKYLLEAGPATPYLRLIGGAAPGAGLSNLYLNVGGTLYQVRTRTISGYDCLTIN